MKEKKKSDLAVLLGYTGSYKGLTYLRPMKCVCWITDKRFFS